MAGPRPSSSRSPPIDLPTILLLAVVAVVAAWCGAAAERRWWPRTDLWREGEPAHPSRGAGPDDDVPADVFLGEVLEHVLTPSRLADQVLGALCEPIAVGPVRRVGVATVTGVGRVTGVTARQIEARRPELAHRVDVAIDLDADVALPGLRVAYSGRAAVTLHTVVRRRSPTTIELDVAHVGGHAVDVRLTSASRSSAALRAVAPVRTIAADVIAETVNDLVLTEDLLAVRVVDLRPMLDAAWQDHAERVAADRRAREQGLHPRTTVAQDQPLFLPDPAGMDA